ncbi:MAG: heterodisulfide reductase subunit A [Rhodocyclaceae bacterium]|uniref:CoB--CoM heterodisulfide reductase iron-sulfur subunit A family protein n=1 Tax=Candidatus Desulfobacillus denitrificans TaxID=2608985 RepID=A0A809RPT1_9PROT|nr:CoB--CoM heterodisulfide reductase iron-sulfur subunit A family protein [Rhodocyclaceae bacterium]BBO21612.1 CoB--CoM heterodisulfide reductase iron-sulfur subunit A family protein [Candidatus Desulfobacillus denitrificans]GIK46447.1 MAG: heterodisulfide reductase subunit A [Betaproteobacteria bacterium]GJQ55982.1 MAG: heterodisulfide reductase subunit A [Rhodocyclaceae bacterium]
MSASIATSQTILVVGGGISGMTAALEAAECGQQVILAEKLPTLGGRTALLYRYFPKMCHPTCGLEINLKRLKGNPNLRIMTMTEVAAVSGTRGDYTVTLKVKPRYVNENCTACGDCGNAVSAQIPNPANYGLDRIKAAYLPHGMAYPQRYVIDPSIVGTPEGEKAKAACKFGAVDLGMQEETVELKVGSVVWATGWRPYDAAKIQPYGYGRIPNVVTSVEFERMADPHGPTGGKLLRADGKEAKNVAFIQCAGSRDENHLRHCSRICCMASLKQTQYVREACGEEGKSTIYYIDIRAIDRFEDFYQSVQNDPTVTFVKSKVARIAFNEETGNPVLHGVDTEGYHRYAAEHDLVVLAVGMEPEVAGVKLPEDIVLDSSNFIEGSRSGGMFGAGAAASPLDVNRAVQSATAASLRAIQVIHKTASTEAA